jgi:hypothetical protein
VLRACAVAEQQGVESIAIVSTGFLRQADAITRALGIPHLPVAEYPGTIPTDTPEVRLAKSREAVAPTVIDLLLKSDGQADRDAEAEREAPGAATAEPEPAPRSIVFSGTLDQVDDFFYERLWTDGLPVVPPTLERVDEFLRHTHRGPEEVLGVLAPDYREATVWSVAVNGVMAGCLPEYLPILIATVEAIADPGFRIQDGGSTPGWEPLVIVSGPVVQRFGFNTETGLMRVGRRANTSIGRFLRLFMRNVAGLRPGTTDKGSIGTTFNVALAEDDAATANVGWPPLRVERGFTLEDDVVTVQSVYAISPPVYSGGTASDHLDALGYILGATGGHWISAGLEFRQFHPLLLLGPSVARVLAEAGLSKDDVRQELYARAKVEAHWVDRWAVPSGVASSERLTKLIERGDAPPDFAENDDPHRLVPALLGPEWTNIVVAGDPGRNQSRFYIQNHAQGSPQSRRVELPV